jgi:benzoyl-CoA reductase/2-hydroxyglutaryl-CoA dehydratase subunit BcrC/BadD/HgdB
MMNVEFSALSYYADLDECIAVLEDIRDTIKQRVEEGVGYDRQEVRLVWITPPADPLLLNYIEALGGRVVGSEYVINQTTPLFREDANPFETLAEAQLASSLMGSTEFRLNLVIDEIEKSQAEGVIISGVFGSTHCPYETIPIMEALRKRKIPVLAFDVVAPGKIRLQSQIYTRMEAFMETLRARRQHNAG